MLPEIVSYSRFLLVKMLIRTKNYKFQLTAEEKSQINNTIDSLLNKYVFAFPIFQSLCHLAPTEKESKMLHIIGINQRADAIT